MDSHGDDRTIALVDAAFGAWAGRDIDEALSLLDPEVVYMRFKTHFSYRHTATGEIVEWTHRVVARVRDGFIARFEEDPDAAVFEAL